MTAGAVALAGATSPVCDDLLDWEAARAFALQELTTYPAKADFYAREPTFREALHEAAVRTAATDWSTLGTALRARGLAVVRPDAVWADKGQQVLDYLERLRLRPVWATRTTVGRHHVREVWRYQLNAASLARLRLMDLLFSQGDSVVVLFDDPDGFWPVPGSAVLADAKGEADPDARAGWELRSALGSPHRLLSFLHTADEPVDAVRDGSLLLSPRAFAEAVVAPPARPEDVRAEVSRAALRQDARAAASLDAAVEALGLPPEEADAWRILETEPPRRPMTAGADADNLINHPGTDAWWERVGALGHREMLLRTAVAGDVPDGTGAALDLVPGRELTPVQRPTPHTDVVPVSRPTPAGGEADAVRRVLDSGWWTGGSTVAALERDLADVTGARHAVAVSSGTAALHAILVALGCDSTTLVVTSSLNFVAVAAAALQLGADLALTDVDPESLAMCPDSLDQVLTAASGTRAIVVPVHYAGRAADMAALGAVASRHGATVAEDAAHVMGSHYRSSDVVVGAWPDSAAAAFSFHPNKPVAAGEGGAVVTSDDELAERVRRFRNHNIVRGDDPCSYEVHQPGLNLRLSELAAAVARVQLAAAPERSDERARRADRYDELLAPLPWLRPLPHPASESSHHLYPVLLDTVASGLTRSALVDHCARRGVTLQVHYQPLHRQPLCARLPRVRDARFPVLDSLAERLVSLPLYAGMGRERQDRVRDALASAPLAR
ncbi:DegT/DnrJ/EryC1/StrS family aminotransferase [Cellulomonas fimi]|uniref:DegT/DnrJ/EryC1/StrS aminotransferase family protein n=1 Tax=Cellulomonas fimi TaxID=1708 RepID=UPI002359AE8E|nr:DegT/DnrJ/EryC1/StrS family aminotransferase [Cellulomonas fimi]